MPRPLLIINQLLLLALSVSCSGGSLLCLLGQIWFSEHSGQHHFCPGYNLTSHDAHVHQLRSSLILWSWAGHASRLFQLLLGLYPSSQNPICLLPKVGVPLQQGQVLMWQVDKNAQTIPLSGKKEESSLEQGILTNSVFCFVFMGSLLHF